MTDAGENVTVHVPGSHPPDAAGRTPGPWFIESHGIMDATRSRTICMFGDSDQDSADALLVASAPDLLRALEVIQQACSAAVASTGGSFATLLGIESIARHALREASPHSGSFVDPST